MLATQPVPTMRTRGLKKRTRSWIVSPASTWPPWELMNTVISSLDSPARASSCAVTPAATRWVLSPLMITVRARNNRSAMRLYGGATDGSSGVNSSSGSPGFVGIVESERLGRRLPALPQLGVRRGPADRGGEPPRGEALVRLLRKVIDPVVVIEPRRGHDALAARADEHVVRAQGHHHRRHVGRADGPAARGRGRHPADVPVLLHAEVDRFAPLVRLIVVVAARVETEIAAQRPHVTE